MENPRHKKTKKSKKKSLSPIPESDIPREEEEDEDQDSAEARGGIIFQKEDIQIIYHALSQYTPTKKEVERYELLLEEFEEILECDYVEIPVE